MANASRGDSVDQRMSRDRDMQTDKTAVLIAQKLDAIETEAKKAATPQETQKIVEEQLAQAKDDIANLVVSKFQAAQQEAQAANEEKRQAELGKMAFLPATIEDTSATFFAAKSLAFAFGNPKLGTALAQGGDITVNMMKTLSSQSMGQYAMCMTTVGLALEAFTLVSSLSADSGPSAEAQIMAMLQQISQQIEDLHKDMVVNFEQTNANMFILDNRLSTQLDTIQKHP